MWHSAFASTGWLATVYFVPALIMGNFIILNLFLGIVLGSFANEDEQSNETALGDKVTATRRKLIRMNRSGALKRYAEDMRRELAKSVVDRLTNAPMADTPATTARSERSTRGDLAALSKPAPVPGLPTVAEDTAPAPTPAAAPLEAAGCVTIAEDTAPAPTPAAAPLEAAGCVTIAEDTAPAPTPAAAPLEAAGCVSKARQLAVRIVKSRTFEAAVMATVIASSVILALDDPMTNPLRRQGLGKGGGGKGRGSAGGGGVVRDIFNVADPVRRAGNIANLVFAVLFTLEAVLKVFAHGLIRSKRAYLREAWNILDLFVVIISWLALLLVIYGVNSSGITVLRSLRALRPLRLISQVHAHPPHVQSWMWAWAEAWPVAWVGVYAYAWSRGG